MLVPRPGVAARIREAFEVHPVVAVLGPRQCGKTTAAAEFARTAGPSHTFDLQRPLDRRRLQTPERTLGNRSGLVVLDEIQQDPGLFDLLRGLVDRPENRARFLLTGSASPSLLRGVSESLAGRVGTVSLAGFDLGETGVERWPDLWLRGGFPRSFLAANDSRSVRWREEFIAAFLERDLPALGIRVPAETLRRFWTMVAHWHGQIWNAAEFARSLGSSEPTARRYLDLLAGTFLVRVLPPWVENLRKRQIRSPRIYLRDTGLLHALLDIADADELDRHPKVGASFEGFAIEQTLAAFERKNAFFWRARTGAELDLLLIRGPRRFGFEAKLSDAPGTTRSMRAALEDLRLDHLFVIYPGDEPYSLDERISVLPLSSLPGLPQRIAAGPPF